MRSNDGTITLDGTFSADGHQGPAIPRMTLHGAIKVTFAEAR